MADSAACMQGRRMLTGVGSKAAAAAASVAALPGALPLLEGRSRLLPTLCRCGRLTGRQPVGPAACRLLVCPITATSVQLAPSPRRGAGLVSSASSVLLAASTVLPFAGLRAPAARRLAGSGHGVVVPPEGGPGGRRGQAVLRTRQPLPAAATTRSWLVPVVPARAMPVSAAICMSRHAMSAQARPCAQGAKPRTCKLTTGAHIPRRAFSRDYGLLCRGRGCQATLRNTRVSTLRRRVGTHPQVLYSRRARSCGGLRHGPLACCKCSRGELQCLAHRPPSAMHRQAL